MYFEWSDLFFGILDVWDHLAIWTEKLIQDIFVEALVTRPSGLSPILQFSFTWYVWYVALNLTFNQIFQSLLFLVLHSDWLIVQIDSCQRIRNGQYDEGIRLSVRTILCAVHPENSLDVD